MTGMPKSTRVLFALVAACFALALILNAAYTTWTLHSELSKSCGLLRAQSASPAYPPAIRADYARLASQRGC